MKCLRLGAVSKDQESQDVEFDKNNSTLLLPQSFWKGILLAGNATGSLAILIDRLEVRCSVCESFMMPAVAFFEFLQQTEAFSLREEEFSETFGEIFSLIYGYMLETKFNDVEAILKHWQHGGGKYRFAADKNGDFIFDKVSGMPMGLAFDDVLIKVLSLPCSSCDLIFPKD